MNLRSGVERMRGPRPHERVRFGSLASRVLDGHHSLAFRRGSKPV
jgi:hypothetical protein